MADTFKLPTSSYEELIKIIRAYSTGKPGQGMSLDALSQSSGMVTTVISGNNGFLLGLDLISEGKAKAPTDLCIKLGRAYTHNISEDIESIWREVIDGNDFLNRMISAIRIRNGMDKLYLINHIIYSSGLTSNGKAKAGAGAVIEILKCAGFVEDNDGKITAKPIENITSSIVECGIKPQSNTVPKNIQGNSDPIPLDIPVSVNAGKCQIVLNLNINGTVDDLDQLADKINKFIKEIAD